MSVDRVKKIKKLLVTQSYKNSVVIFRMGIKSIIFCVCLCYLKIYFITSNYTTR